MGDKKTLIVTFLTAIAATLLTLSLAKSELEYSAIDLFYLCLGLIVVTLFGDFLLHYFKKKIKKSITNLVYRRFKSTIEYVDAQGKEVSVNSTIEIAKLTLRWNKDTTNEVFTDGIGTIEAEVGKGINVDLVSESDTELCFKTKFASHNLVKKRHFLGYGVKFKDVFNNPNMMFWYIGPKHKCYFYELTLIYPDPSKELHLTFEKGEKCDGNICENWQIDNTIDYSTYTRFGKKVAKVLLLNINNTQAYRVKWNFV